jgi:ERCC4-type nuclease
MKIILDCRERGLYDKIYMMEIPPNVVILTEQLDIGDIIIKTDEDAVVSVIERKQITDFLSSVTDGRYSEQSHRLKHAAPRGAHIIYLLEGVISNYPVPKKKIIYGAITSLEFFKGFSVWRASTLTETAELLLHCAQKLHKEIYEKKTPLAIAPAPAPTTEGGVGGTQENIMEDDGDVVAPAAPPPAYASVVKACKKENITAENIGEIMLLQIPNISASSAAQIMEGCKNIGAFIDKLRANPDFLTEIKIGTGEKKRKLSKTVVENIKKYLL